MKGRLFKNLAGAGVAAFSVLSLAPAAFAASGTTMYQANLSELNGSGDSGTATVKVLDNNQVKVTLHVDGASANLPHAQHIHIGGNNVCPTMDAAGSDKILSTVEGQPAYGSVKVSLTTSGDTSADSAVAVKRFPTANSDGQVTYSRTFTLPDGVSASDLANGVIVQHGVSEIGGDQAKYDGDAKSKLDDSLPLEATAPSSCGELTAMPVGGAGTGSGSSAGIENTELLAIGGLAVAAGGATYALSRKKVLSQS